MVGLLLDAKTGDLSVTNGGLALGDIRAQVAEMVLTASPGEFKEVPTIGGGATLMLGGSRDAFWGANMKAQLKAMGVEVEKIAEAEEGVELTIKE